MEVYDQNVQKFLGISNEINTLEEAEEVHRQLIDFRIRLIQNGSGDYFPYYRTEQVFGWNITPGLFRVLKTDITPMEAKQLEKKAIERFEEEVKKKIGETAFRDLFLKRENGKSWDLLMQAQHGGVRTSLVDWTQHIERSIFFGVESSGDDWKDNQDGQLWAYMVYDDEMLTDNRRKGKKSYHDHDPFNNECGFMVNTPVDLDDLEARIFEQRIFRQGGRFYISAVDKCNIPMNQQPKITEHLFRFRIPAASKVLIREHLERRGVNRESIYIQESPDQNAWIEAINKECYNC